MDCTMFECGQPATHLMLVWRPGMRTVEGYVRCQAHGRSQVNVKLVQRVHPEARTALVKLPAVFARAGVPA